MFGTKVHKYINPLINTTMFKKLKSYLKNRRERKLREYFATNPRLKATSKEIQEWVDFVLYGKPTTGRLGEEAATVKKVYRMVSSPKPQEE